MGTAEHREPYEARVSRTVLGARGGARFPRATRQTYIKLRGRWTYLYWALEAVEEAEAEIASSRSPTSIRGTLRVHSLPAFALYQPAPRIPALISRYPDLQVEFLLSNETPNFIEQKIDVSIQSGDLVDAALMRCKLGTSCWVIFAAPSYLAEKGVSETPEDLQEHNCLNFTPEIPFREWSVIDSRTRKPMCIKVEGSVSSNHGEMLLDLARLGVGIVRLAEFHIGGET